MLKSTIWCFNKLLCFLVSVFLALPHGCRSWISMPWQRSERWFSLGWVGPWRIWAVDGVPSRSWFPISDSVFKICNIIESLIFPTTTLKDFSHIRTIASVLWKRSNINIYIYTCTYIYISLSLFASVYIYIHYYLYIHIRVDPSLAKGLLTWKRLPMPWAQAPKVWFVSSVVHLLERNGSSTCLFHWFFDCFGVWKPKGMESQEATGVNSDTWLQAR